MPCVSVEKPSEVMPVAAESGYMCVVHAGQLTLAVLSVLSSPVSLFPLCLFLTHKFTQMTPLEIIFPVGRSTLASDVCVSEDWLAV